MIKACIIIASIVLVICFFQIAIRPPKEAPQHHESSIEKEIRLCVTACGAHGVRSYRTTLAFECECNP